MADTSVIIDTIKLSKRHASFSDHAISFRGPDADIYNMKKFLCTISKELQQMDGLIDGWVDGWIDRWMDSQMDGWTDG